MRGMEPDSTTKVVGVEANDSPKPETSGATNRGTLFENCYCLYRVRTRRAL